MRVHLESLQEADPQQLAKFLEVEHPQTIALILAHLNARQASALLMRLPEEVRAETVKRLAQLRQFSPEVAAEGCGRAATSIWSRSANRAGAPMRDSKARPKC